MKSTVIDLQELVPDLENSKIKIRWTDNGRIKRIPGYIAVYLLPPAMAEKYGEKTVIEAVIYATAYLTDDYQIFAAWYIYKVQNNTNASEEMIYKILTSFKRKVFARTNPFASGAEAYHGMFYALKYLDDVVVVIPPEDPTSREKLRVKLEGVRVSNGKRYGGLIKRLEAEKLHPWVYRIKSYKIEELLDIVKNYGGRVVF